MRINREQIFYSCGCLEQGLKYSFLERRFGNSCTALTRLLRPMLGSEENCQLAIMVYYMYTQFNV